MTSLRSLVLDRMYQTAQPNPKGNTKSNEEMNTRHDPTEPHLARRAPQHSHLSLPQGCDDADGIDFLSFNFITLRGVSALGVAGVPLETPELAVPEYPEAGRGVDDPPPADDDGVP